MTQYTSLPIDPAVLKELRARDDAGAATVPFTDDEGGAPLRCCLRASAPGERIALVTYAPLRRWAALTGATPGAYDEQGPVFVHADDCGGPDPGRATRHPFARPGALRVLRRYDTRGHIDGGTLFAFPPADAAAAAVRPDAGVAPDAGDSATADAAGAADGDDVLDAALDAAFDAAFADPGVALVHVRAVEYGCFHCEVRRP